MEVTTSAQRWS